MESEDDEFDDGFSCFELEPLTREPGKFYLEALNHQDIWYHRPVKRSDKNKGNNCVKCVCYMGEWKYRLG